MAETQILDYSGRDFTATFERQISRLNQDVPELTDLNHSDGGISLIRLNSRELDQLHFYLDLIFSEGFIESALFLQDAIRLARLVECKPMLASGALTRLLITRVDNSNYNNIVINIPVFTSFSREDGVGFVTLQSVAIPVGVQSVYVDAMQGVLVDVVITPTDFVYPDLTGNPKYNMGSGVAAGSVVLTHSEDTIVWQEVESFWRSMPSDYHYSLELFADEYNNETNTVFLVIGDGTYGASVPETGLHLRYIRTDGAAGNSGSGVVNLYPNTFVGVITVTNADYATGGSDVETLSSFKDRIPAVVRTQRRGVVLEDYEALVKSIPGVADCQAIDRNLVTYYPWEFVALYVVPVGGGALPGALYDTIMQQLQSWGHLQSWSGRYLLQSVTEIVVPVSVRIGVLAGYLPASVQAAVVLAIQSCFTLDRISVGSPLSFSLLHTACSRVVGVSWVEFDAPTTDVAISFGELPIVGDVLVTVIA